MPLRQIAGAGCELDGFSIADEGREKEHAARDVLGALGQVLAYECVVKTEPVGEDDRVAILLQGIRRAPMLRVHRHREITQSHLETPERCAAVLAAKRAKGASSHGGPA